jgi:tRNA(Leu) C34 or U34 (ribose-2'-O)-methylase TrmL
VIKGNYPMKKILKKFIAIAISLAAFYEVNAETLTWTGKASDNKLATKENWNPCKTPQSGDALVFGNESSGLPKEFYERYRDQLFRIPMPGEHARSINLANAVSIAAYECYRQLFEL